MTLATDPFAAALQRAYQALGLTDPKFQAGGGRVGTAISLETQENPENSNLGSFPLGIGIRVVNQSIKARIPTIPTKNGNIETPAPAPDAAEAWAAWQERAAIREYDGGMPRQLAEMLTAVELGPCPPGGPGDWEAAQDKLQMRRTCI